jgi:hypothetical protein
MAVSGTDGTLTTLCILDQRLFSWKLNTFG